MPGIEPGAFTCKANAVPLSYIAILEDRAFKKYIFSRTLLRCYDKGGMKWILLTIFIKPFFYERFLDWHNTRFNGLTHIFFRLVGRLLLTCKNIMPHVKILEHISSSNISKLDHIPKTPLAWKKLKKKEKKKRKKKKKGGPFCSQLIGNEIKICSQNKCHHHLSNVCENSFRISFHGNWVISDYHSFVWAVC